MQNHSSSSGTNEVPPFDTDTQALDQLVAQAVEAAAKGENVEQILEIMLVSLPAGEREKVKKKFIAALAKKGLRQPNGDADIPSRATLARIRNALAVSTKLLTDRIMRLIRARPDLANSIRQAGDILVKNGVMADKVVVSETDLGTMAPVVVGKPTQDRGAAGRG